MYGLCTLMQCFILIFAQSWSVGMYVPNKRLCISYYFIFVILICARLTCEHWYSFPVPYSTLGSTIKTSKALNLFESNSFETKRLGGHQKLLMSLLLRAISIRLIAWIRNQVHVKQWDVITHPCINVDGDFVKPPLKLLYEWIITSHMKLRM